MRFSWISIILVTYVVLRMVFRFALQMKKGAQDGHMLQYYLKRMRDIYVIRCIYSFITSFMKGFSTPHLIPSFHLLKNVIIFCFTKMWKSVFTSSNILINGYMKQMSYIITFWYSSFFTCIVRVTGLRHCFHDKDYF